MKTNFLHIEGLNIFIKYNYRPVENPERKNNETILFVHGWPDTHSTWDRQFDDLAGEFNVAAIDLPGAGKSDAPSEVSGYRIDHIMSILNHVMDWLVGTHEKMHLVGHDWGAIISWCYASDAILGPRLKSYTAISCPHVKISTELMRRKLTSPNIMDKWQILKQLGKSWYIMFFQLPFLPELVLNNFTQPMWNMMMNSAQIPPSDSMHQLTSEEILSASVNGVNLYRQLMRYGAPDLRYQVVPPVSLIIPEHDLAISPESYNGTEKFVRSLEKNLIDANHWVHRSHPSEVNKIIRGFVKKHAG